MIALRKWRVEIKLKIKRRTTNQNINFETNKSRKKQNETWRRKQSRFGMSIDLKILIMYRNSKHNWLEINEQQQPFIKVSPPLQRLAECWGSRHRKIYSHPFKKKVSIASQFVSSHSSSRWGGTSRWSFCCWQHRTDWCRCTPKSPDSRNTHGLDIQSIHVYAKTRNGIKHHGWCFVFVL